MKNDWFTIKEVFPKIYGLAEFGHFEEVISYLLVGKKKALLFDTGMGIGDIYKEVAKITSLPIFVMNSHTHFDHIGNNNLFKTVFIYNHSYALDNAKKGFSSDFMKPHIEKKTFLKSPPKIFKKNNFEVSSFTYSKKIKNGEIIMVDPFLFKVIYTPGHSPDSICLYETKNKLLFSGDSIYPGPIYLQMPESNIRDFKKSVHRLSKIEVKHIFPAHNAFTQSPEVIQSIEKQLKSKENFKKKKIVINKHTSLILQG